MSPRNQRRAICCTNGNDLMALATQSATAPTQVVAILLLDRRVDAAALKAALMKVAATAGTHPVPRDHPLWSMTLGSGLESGWGGTPPPDSAAVTTATRPGAPLAGPTDPDLPLIVNELQRRLTDLTAGRSEVRATGAVSANG